MLLLCFENRVESIIPANNFGPVSGGFLAARAQAPNGLPHGPREFGAAKVPRFFKWPLELQSLKNPVRYSGKQTAWVLG